MMLILYASCLMRSRIASERGLSSPPSSSYQPLASHWEQKIVDDFLRLLWRSSRMSCCSDSVGFSRSHSSMISRTGLTYFPWTFLYVPSLRAISSSRSRFWKPDILCLVALLTCFHPERTGQISLSTSSSPGNKEIPVLCDIFTGCKPFNQGTVQLTPGSIVDITNVCLWLVKPCIADQSF